MPSSPTEQLDTPPLVGERPDRLGVALSAVRRRLGLLRWLVPAAMFILVVLYEAGPARWILNTYGATYHLAAELAVYGLLGPVTAAILLDLLGRWIEERETTELQARALAQARAHAEHTHRLTDDILQTLFAVSTLVGSIEDRAEDLPSGAAEQLHATHRALDDAIQRLYARLKDN
jgi:hypothetical protein